jgi:hypothetical protein
MESERLPITALAEAHSAPGNWSLYIADIAINSTDGTVTHLFNGESQTLPLWTCETGTVSTAAVTLAS